MQNNFILLSPDDLKILGSMAPDPAQTQAIYRAMSCGQPIAIIRNGQPEKEETLAGWIRRKGGKVVVVPRVIQFDMPSHGRGGENHGRR